MSEVEFVTRLDAAQAGELWAMFQREWWCAGRTPEQVRRLLEGPSLVFALVTSDTRRLVAFARVVTDGVFKAWVLDVMVAPDRRGAGLGRALLERVTNDPRLAGVAQMELYCAAELVPFYEPFGFRAPAIAVRLLRREGEQ